MTCQANSLFSDLFADAADLKDNATGFDNCNPVVYSTFTTTHTGFGWLGGDRLVREYANPHFPTTLHKAGERDTRGFNLTSFHPAGFKGLQSIFATAPTREVLSDEFVRNYYRYADQLFEVKQKQSDFTPLASKDFEFELYSSGEYSRMLERAWES